MDFFLDSGIFYGICDPRDKHNVACKKFFTKYPLNTNDYYTAKMVKKELRRKRIRIIKNPKMGYDNTTLRRIEQEIGIWFGLMNDLLKYEEENYPNFIYLVRDIERLTEYNQNDAIIAANALVWSYEQELNNPTLVTTDFKHLVKKSDKILEQAELRLSERPISLEIKAVWDI